MGHTRRQLSVRTGMVIAAVALIAGVTWAQLRSDNMASFVPISADRKGVPDWINEPMPKDVFTFVRIRYHSSSSRFADRWTTDYPDSDLNLSLRLQELTSLRVDPLPIQLDFTDPKIKDFPFVYVVEPGFMQLSAREITAMRDYCLNGGFVMFDDHWGPAQYQNVERHLRQAFPEFRLVELTAEHPIFHAVFDFQQPPQVFTPGGAVSNRGESQVGPPRYVAVFDANNRMMAIVCHNTDTGDAWEREGVDEWYFQEYAVKKAYPLAINIIFYAMTH